MALGDHNDSATKRYSAVSPLGTPVLGARDSGSDFCVSPIDEKEHFPHHERNDFQRSTNRSQKPPLADIEPVQSTQKAVHFVLDPNQSHWDDFPGEPTINAAAKAGQVTPRNTTFHKASHSHTSNFLHWGREHIQPKRKLAQPRNRSSGHSRNELSAVRDSRGRSLTLLQPLREHSRSRSQSRDASPPLSNLGFVPTVVTTITAGHTKPPERPFNEHAIIKPREERQETTKTAETTFDAAIADMMRSDQAPGQLLSAPKVTMRAENLNRSPDGSPRESLNLGSQSTDDLPSIMARQRPIPLSMPTSRKPVRKPIPSEVAQEPASVEQPQPKEPPKDAHGRIHALEAHRDDLARRRINLETVIKELTRVIEPISIAYDRAAKAEVKKSVESIENEIAEIKKEEHELGMKITRAWRRLDERENNGDGSNLWVKRVTS